MDLLDSILGQGTYNALLGNSNATSNYQGQECANSQNSFYGAWAANSQAAWLTANSMPSRITRFRGSKYDDRSRGKAFGPKTLR